MKIRRHPASTLFATQWAIYKSDIVPASIASSITEAYIVTKNTGSGLTIETQKSTFAAAEIAWVNMCNDSAGDSYLGGSSRADVTRFEPFNQVIVDSIVQDK